MRGSVWRPRMHPDKDYYQILGVASVATGDEIRDAYIARSRVVHPDRFDRETQPREWKLANKMLAELNEAYSTLRNSEERRAYDHRRSRSEPVPPVPPPQSRQSSQPRKPAPPDLSSTSSGFRGYFRLG